MKKFIVTENTTLAAFTDNTCAQASFVFGRLLKAREIRVNGEKVSADLPLRAGDEVCYFMTPAQEARAAFTVLWEDENVLAVDKESGVNSEAVFSELSRAGEVFFLHRLDRNTAGVLLFAKNRRAEEVLLAAFRTRKVEKLYLALVAGKMPARHAVEEGILVKDAEKARVRVFPADAKRAGERIVTEYEVLEERGECSLLAVTLHTGKTHQIRAHLAFLGHPVVGDEKYGDSAFNRKLHAARQRLIAKQLTLYTEELGLYGKTFRSPRTL